RVAREPVRPDVPGDHGLREARDRDHRGNCRRQSGAVAGHRAGQQGDRPDGPAGSVERYPDRRALLHGARPGRPRHAGARAGVASQAGRGCPGSDAGRDGAGRGARDGARAVGGRDRRRGVPGVDLRLKFGMPETEYNRFAVVIVVAVSSKVVGLLADGVTDVLTLAKTNVQAAPDFGTPIEAGLISGMAKAGEKVVIL